MTNIDHVLDAIDHALQDEGISGDAMRWAPSAEPQQSIKAANPSALYVAPIGTISWQHIGWLDEADGYTFSSTEIWDAATVHQMASGFIAAICRMPFDTSPDMDVFTGARVISSRSFNPQEPEEE